MRNDELKVVRQSYAESQLKIADLTALVARLGTGTRLAPSGRVVLTAHLRRRGRSHVVQDRAARRASRGRPPALAAVGADARCQRTRRRAVFRWVGRGRARALAATNQRACITDEALEAIISVRTVRGPRPPVHLRRLSASR
jgi:hypothetical protein